MMSFRVSEDHFSGDRARSGSEVRVPQEKSTSSIFNLYGLFSGHRVQQDQAEQKRGIFDFKWGSIFGGISNFFTGHAGVELKSPQVVELDVLARANESSASIIKQVIEQRAKGAKDEQKFKGKSPEAIRESIKNEVEEAIRKQVAFLVKEEPWSLSNFFSLFAPKLSRTLLEDRLLAGVVSALQDPSHRSSNQLLVERYVERRMSLRERHEITAEEKKQMEDEIKGEVDLLVRELTDQALKVEGESSSDRLEISFSPKKVAKEDALLQSALQLEIKAIERMGGLKQKKIELEAFQQSLPHPPNTIENEVYQNYRNLKQRRDAAVAGIKAVLQRIQEMERNYLALDSVIKKLRLKPNDKVDDLRVKLGMKDEKLIAYIQSMNDVRRRERRVKSEDSIERLLEQSEIDFYAEIESQQISSRVKNIKETSVPLPHEIRTINSLQSSAESEKLELEQQKKEFVKSQSGFLVQLQKQRTLFDHESLTLEETMKEIISLYEQCKMRPAYSLDVIKREFTQKAEEIDTFLEIKKDLSEVSLLKKLTNLTQEYDLWIALLKKQQSLISQQSGHVPSCEELSVEDQTMLRIADEYSKKVENYKAVKKEKELQKKQELEKQKKAVAEQERLKQEEAQRLAERAVQEEEQHQMQVQSMPHSISPASSAVDARDHGKSEAPSNIFDDENASPYLESASAQPARRIIPKSVTKYTKIFTKPVTSLFKTKVFEPPLTLSASRLSTPPMDLKEKVISRGDAGTTQPGMSTEQGQLASIPVTQKYESEDID